MTSLLGYETRLRSRRETHAALFCFARGMRSASFAQSRSSPYKPGEFRLQVVEENDIGRMPELAGMVPRGWLVTITLNRPGDAARLLSSA